MPTKAARSPSLEVLKQPTPGVCPKKEQLLHSYRIAAADYARIVTLLAEQAGVMSKADYIEIRDYSAGARAKVLATRNAMDRHVAEHGC